MKRDDYPTIPVNDQILTYLLSRPQTTAGIAVAFSIGFQSAKTRLEELRIAGKVYFQDGLWAGKRSWK